MQNDEAWDKRLIVEPNFQNFHVENSRPSAAASIDFHLGNRFTVFRRRRGVLHHPLNNKTTNNREGEKKKVEMSDVSTEEFFVSFGDYFVLHPGHLVLGTTLEWFRLPMDLMAYVVGRSIWGRRGLLIATATAVQPGSAGTITLELSNTGEIAVELQPGLRIGQLFFHNVEGCDQDSKRTQFSGALRPILGNYTKSKSENFLTGL
jgi:dCTP deaminase